MDRVKLEALEFFDKTSELHAIIETSQMCQPFGKTSELQALIETSQKRRHL
jgi:hypothetical protein